MRHQSFSKDSPLDGRNGGGHVTAAVINPIVGNIQCSFFTKITPRIASALRYDFNMYSFDSDLAGALSITAIDSSSSFEKEEDHAKATGMGSIILRCSWRHGLAILLQIKSNFLTDDEAFLDTSALKQKNYISGPKESFDPKQKCLSILAQVGLGTGPVWTKPLLTDCIPTPMQFLDRPSVGFSISVER